MTEQNGEKMMRIGLFVGLSAVTSLFAIFGRAAAHPYDSSIMPRIVSPVMESVGCNPIEGFYDRDHVYRPPFSAVVNWNGEAYFAFICDSNDSEGYLIVIRSISYTFEGEENVARLKEPENFDCSDRILIDELPYSVEIGVQEYRADVDYHNHFFSEIEAEDGESFLFLTDENLSDRAIEYVCYDGQWVMRNIY